jgi:hypothetical protein
MRLLVVMAPSRFTTANVRPEGRGVKAA